VVQDGSLLESSCPFITEKLGEMEIESIQPYEMLSALPESARKRFYDMAGIEYEEIGTAKDRKDHLFQFRNFSDIRIDHFIPGSGIRSTFQVFDNLIFVLNI